MRKLNGLFCLLFCAICFGISAQRNLAFYEEHIDFTLDSAWFQVNGIYAFRNVTNREISQRILFPFAGKTIEIDSLRIFNLSTGRKISLNRLENSISFNLMLLAGDSVDVNIYYRQKVSRLNSYVLTSTQSWGNPLEKAVYTLSAANYIVIKNFTYEPDSVQVLTNHKLYSWTKHQFMPDKDFEIEIEKSAD